MSKQIILPEDVELTEEVKTLYKDKHGKYYLTKEVAQNRLATHFKCTCGNGIREKYRIFCDSCEPKNEEPFKEWDGKGMLYVSNSDLYFSTVEEIEEHYDDEGIDKGSLKIYICEPNYLHEVNEDYWDDIFAEDGELPGDIQDKLDALNKAIIEYKVPISWSPSKYLAKIDWSDLQGKE